MTQEQEVQKLPATQITQPRGVQSNSVLTWIGIFALVLVAILAYVTISTQEAVSKEMVGQAFYTNPELKNVDRHVQPISQQAKAEFIANNPELLSANRYAENKAFVSGKTNLYQNPELKLRDPEFKSSGNLSSLFETNPEIKAHLRFKEVSYR